MLEEKLRELAKSEIYPFHMPGHKRTMDFGNPYSMDITEIDGFDNLHHPTGILRDAQEQAAELYGSGRAYYLVNGSTCGILAAISAAVPRTGKILVARNSHKAVYHALFLRQLTAEYLYPVITKNGLQGQITPEMVEEKLKEDAQIQAVVITSPTYDGIVSDIRGIAKAVHARNIPLIVDEAHGAHFGFSSEFPENAVRYADAVIMSVHKTLPAFTQTALLHLCSDRIDHAQVEKYLGIYETSSPSYVLIVGIERSLRMIREEGNELFANYAGMLGEFRQSVSDLRNLKVLDKNDFTEEEIYDFDRGKLLMETGGKISGQELAQRLLHSHGLQMEMACGNYVVALTSVMDTCEGFRRLSEALHEIDRTLDVEKEKKILSPGDIYQKQKKAEEIWEAEEGQQETVALEQAVGRESAEYVYLYPPGIPIVVPGEWVNERTVQVIEESRRLGLDVEGLQNFPRINVVKK